MRNFIATLAALAISILPATVSAQINTSIGTSGGICWDNNAGTVTCKDVTNNNPLGSYSFGLGNSGLANFGSYLALGSDDAVDTVQIRNLADNATCVVEGHGFGLGGSATHVYVTNYYQNKLVKVANDLSVSSCSAATDVPLLGLYPRRVITLGTKLYVLTEGGGGTFPSIDEVDTSNGDAVTTHSLGGSGSDNVQDMAYDPGSDSFIVSYNGGLWAMSRTTWTKTSWSDITTAMAAVGYLDGYMVASSYASTSGYIFPDPSTPTNKISVSLSFAVGALLGYSNIGLTAFFMDSSGLNYYDLLGNYQGQVTTDFGGMVYVMPWATAQTCNNGTREGTEQCDGSDFGGQTCQSRGYFGGSLSCSSGCTIDESGCNFCGNGVVNIGEGEQCDGTNLNGATCESLNFGPGTLGCNSSCLFDTSQCTTAQNCNNGVIEGNEECDGGNLGGHTCQEYGFAGGTPTCNPMSCTIDTSNCTMCGNGNIDSGEQCDGGNLNGATCESLGFNGGGTLTCSATCNYDTSTCTNQLCGNGVVDTPQGEECDDGNQTNSDGCSSTCQVESGYECSGEPSTCSLLCGNDRLDDGEECDGEDFGQLTCQDLGYESGTPSCTNACTIDESTCLACNQTGIAQVAGDELDRSKLNDHDLTLYTTHLTSLTKDSITECETVSLGGQQVEAIAYHIASGSYENVRIQIGDKVAMCQAYAEEEGAIFYIDKNDPQKTLVVGGPGSGVICTEDGANIQVHFEGLVLAALGTGFSARKVSTNPRTGVAGNWLEVFVSDAVVNLFEFAFAGNHVNVGFSDMWDGPVYVNLDAMGDLTKILNRILKPPKKGCGCSQSNRATPTGVIYFGILMLWLLSVRRSRRRASARIQKN